MSNTTKGVVPGLTDCSEKAARLLIAVSVMNQGAYIRLRRADQSDTNARGGMQHPDSLLSTTSHLEVPNAELPQYLEGS